MDEQIPNITNHRQGDPYQGRDGERPRIAVVMLALLGFAFVGSAFGVVVFMGVSHWMHWPDELLQGGLAADAPIADRQAFRFLLLCSQLGTFLFAGWATTWLFYHKNTPYGPAVPTGWVSYLKAGVTPSAVQLSSGALMMIVGLPFVLWLYQINKALPLPEGIKQMEAQATETLKVVMTMEYPSEFWFNLFLVAVIPAIGEEWVFRGIVQQQFMRWIRHPLFAIWLSAAVFSFIHFQFEGFLPRMWLGILLGWLYWTSRNFWVPVFAHFVNNALQVAGQYAYRTNVSDIDLEKDHHIPIAFAMLSLTLVFALAYRLKRSNH
jgi:membrane protease YdiL (CAAX protease family)